MGPERFEDLPEWVAVQIIDNEQNPDNWDEIAAYAAEYEVEPEPIEVDCGPRSALRLLGDLQKVPVSGWSDVDRWEYEALDLEVLSEFEMLEYLAVTDRMKNSADAHQNLVLSVIAAKDPTLRRFTQETVGSMLHIAPITAANRLNTAHVLTTELPGTFAATLTGELGPGQARTLVSTVQDFTELRSAEDTSAFAKELENRVLPHIFDTTNRRTRELIERAALRIDPEMGKQRAKTAKAHRDVTVQDCPDGMAAMTHVGPAATIRNLFLKLNAKVEELPADDERTVGQQRSDLLADAILAGLRPESVPADEADTDAPLPKRRPAQDRDGADVQVYVDLATLLGLRDEPGFIDGYGPIDAETARDIAEDPTSTWHRIIFDPETAALLDYGRTTYRPPEAPEAVREAQASALHRPWLPQTRRRLR